MLRKQESWLSSKKKKEAQLSGSKEHYAERDKVFKFNLVVTTEDGLVTNKDYLLTVTTLFKNSPPSFKGDLGELIAFVGEDIEWDLPEMTDEEQDEISSITIEP